MLSVSVKPMTSTPSLKVTRSLTLGSRVLRFGMAAGTNQGINILSCCSFLQKHTRLGHGRLRCHHLFLDVVRYERLCIERLGCGIELIGKLIKRTFFIFLFRKLNKRNSSSSRTSFWKSHRIWSITLNFIMLSLTTSSLPHS